MNSEEYGKMITDPNISIEKAREALTGKIGEFAPVVEPADIKKLWNYGVEQDKKRPNRGQVATGMGIVISLCGPEADLTAVCFRARMLGMVAKFTTDLAPFLKDGQPDDRVFSVFATAPMKYWEAPGVVSEGLPFDTTEVLARLKAG